MLTKKEVKKALQVLRNRGVGVTQVQFNERYEEYILTLALEKNTNFRLSMYSNKIELTAVDKNKINKNSISVKTIKNNYKNNKIIYRTTGHEFILSY